MKNSILLISLILFFLSCSKSKNDKKNDVSVFVKDSLTKINKIENNFKNSNKVYCDIDTLLIYYSFESEKYINKNLFSKHATVLDIYKKDSLKYVLLNTANYNLDLEVTENQFNYLKNNKYKGFLDGLKAVEGDRFFIFNIASFKKENDIFMGQGKLISIKDLE
jgi:hypothetical protein